MGWKYTLIYNEDGYRMAEDFGEDCHGFLTEDDWLFESEDEAIEVLSAMLKDLKSTKKRGCK